jgi:hypothetical protein
MHERALAGARDALGTGYEAHFAEGRELTAEDAVASLQSGRAELAAIKRA